MIQASLNNLLSLGWLGSLKSFLSFKIKNDLSDPSQPKLSKLFSWYSGDFKLEGQTVIDFINKYASVKIPENANVDYLDYNWNLNE